MTTAPTAIWETYGAHDALFVAGGHSHVVSLLAALMEQPEEHPRSAVVYSPLTSGIVPEGEDYWARVSALARDRVAVVVWNGNQHQASFLVAPEPPFRVFHPGVASHLWEADAERAAGVWVPRSTFREHWAWTYDDFARVLATLTATSEVVVLGTPPPKRNGFIREVLEGESMFVELAASKGIAASDLALTSEATRLALWHTIQDDMGEIARAAGATFLWVPDATIDAEGFLRDEFSGPDVTHANAAYGALMWRTVYEHTAPRHA